jgi:hypothetical protein
LDLTILDLERDLVVVAVFVVLLMPKFGNGKNSTGWNAFSDVPTKKMHGNMFCYAQVEISCNSEMKMLLQLIFIIFRKASGVFVRKTFLMQEK